MSEGELASRLSYFVWSSMPDEALFALARTVGWVAHWNEMISDPEQKIGRPRQLYVGEPQREYVPVDRR